MGITGGWSILRQRLRTALTGRPPEPTSSATNGRVPVRSPEELLAQPERLARLQAIKALTRVTPAHFEVLYRSALSNYAGYVQQLPASEARHHAGLGGLLDHGLEAAVFALKLRRGHLLPRVRRPSSLTRKRTSGPTPASLISNGDRAVWSARITLGGWQQDLTLLRFPVSRLWPDSAIRPDTCHGTIQPLAYTNVAAAPETPRRPRKASWINHLLG
ncbi:MAG: TraI domain-containing protein [Gammaproteobacteria bacterium]